MTWIGFKFDTVAMQIQMPQEKIDNTVLLLRDWHKRTSATHHQLQQLLGLFFHIAQCCRPARLFLSRLLGTFRAAPAHGSISLNVDFQKDVSWFQSFLPAYNGIHLIPFNRPVEPERVEVDSCLTGCAGIWGQEYYHECFPGFITESHHHISRLEMLNITVAVKLWEAQWKHKLMNIVCDNSAAVNVLQSGRGCDSFLLSYEREIWYWSALHDFEIRVSHAPGLAMSRVDALTPLLDKMAGCPSGAPYDRNESVAGHGLPSQSLCWSQCPATLSFLS